MWKLHLHDSVDMVGLKATWLSNKKKIRMKLRKNKIKRKIFRSNFLFILGIKLNNIKVVLTWFNWLGKFEDNLNDY
jgi:uncharacterized membrane protein SpoIIM required for sporulation